MNLKAVLALPKTARSAQTHKSISFIWIVWSTLSVYLWRGPQTPPTWVRNFINNAWSLHEIQNWCLRSVHFRYIIILTNSHFGINSCFSPISKARCFISYDNLSNHWHWMIRFEKSNLMLMNHKIKGFPNKVRMPGANLLL